MSDFTEAELVELEQRAKRVKGSGVQSTPVAPDLFCRLIAAIRQRDKVIADGLEASASGLRAMLVERTRERDEARESLRARTPRTALEIDGSLDPVDCVRRYAVKRHLLSSDATAEVSRLLDHPETEECLDVIADLSMQVQTVRGALESCASFFSTMDCVRAAEGPDERFIAKARLHYSLAREDTKAALQGKTIEQVWAEDSPPSASPPAVERETPQTKGQ